MNRTGVLVSHARQCGVVLALLLAACTPAAAPRIAPVVTPSPTPAAAVSIGSFKAIGQPFATLGLKCASSSLTNGPPRVLCDFQAQPGALVELIATATSQGQLLASLGLLFNPGAPTAQETAALQLFLADADAIANQQASAWFSPQLSVYTNASTERKTLVEGTFGTVQLLFTGIAGAVLLTVRVPR